MFEWFPTNEFIIIFRDFPHLVLIGLMGIYPYAPLRVMRQAGRRQIIPWVTKMCHFRADFQGDAIPYKNEAQHMWTLKIIVEKDTIEPDRYHADHSYLYPSWLEDNIAGVFEPRAGPGNKVIDEVAEVEVKYNKLRKRV